MQPLVDKYRPSSLDDIVSHQEITNTLRQFVKSDSLPHMMFHGPPGTGKTSTAHALAQEVFPTHYHQSVLELNASDDRGIGVVRDQIKSFASTTWRLGTSESASRLSNLKLIILDEADHMTSDAQMALRRVIEKYSENVRFCIICNLGHKITPALQSRCTKFRFPPLQFDEMVKRASSISQSENMPVNPDAIHCVVKHSQGDMRKVINTLEACKLKGEYPIASSTILRTLGYPTEEEIDVLMDTLLNKSLNEAVEALRTLTYAGAAMKDVVYMIYNRMLDVSWPRLTESEFYKRLRTLEEAIHFECDPAILESFCSAIFTECKYLIQRETQA